MSFQTKALQIRDKRGISVMIGYVLLVAFAVIIGVITYAWIKTYVPADSIVCSDGVSLYISDVNFDAESNDLVVNIKNNGRFNVDGYFIQVKNDSEQEIANINIAEYLSSGGNVLGNAVRIEGQLKPNQEIGNTFNLPEAIGSVLSVTITPFQYKTFGNRQRLVSCGDARVSQNV